MTRYRRHRPKPYHIDSRCPCDRRHTGDRRSVPRHPVPAAPPCCDWQRPPVGGFAPRPATVIGEKEDRQATLIRCAVGKRPAATARTGCGETMPVPPCVRCVTEHPVVVDHEVAGSRDAENRLAPGLALVARSRKYDRQSARLFLRRYHSPMRPSCSRSRETLMTLQRPSRSTSSSSCSDQVRPRRPSSGTDAGRGIVRPAFTVVACVGKQDPAIASVTNDPSELRGLSGPWDRSRTMVELIVASLLWRSPEAPKPLALPRY